MKTTYTARSYDPTKPYRRYVRNDHGDGYRWCETDGRWDVRQGSVDASELPDDVRAAADARCGWSPPYVEWPNHQRGTQ